MRKLWRARPRAVTYTCPARAHARSGRPRLPCFVFWFFFLVLSRITRTVSYFPGPDPALPPPPPAPPLLPPCSPQEEPEEPRRSPGGGAEEVQAEERAPLGSPGRRGRTHNVGCCRRVFFLPRRVFVCLCVSACVCARAGDQVTREKRLRAKFRVCCFFVFSFLCRCGGGRFRLLQPKALFSSTTSAPTYFYRVCSTPAPTPSHTRTSRGSSALLRTLS